MPNANVYLPPVITVPSSLNITAITNSNPMEITVEISNDSTENNNYIVGMSVSLFIPYSYKMFQADKLVGTILDIDDLTFTLDIDSSNFDVFEIPAGTAETPASISPAGSRNYIYTNGSSNIPFKSLNNIGN